MSEEEPRGVKVILYARSRDQDGFWYFFKVMRDRDVILRDVLRGSEEPTQKNIHQFARKLRKRARDVLSEVEQEIEPGED